MEKKGERSRQWIIDNSVKVFNKHGIDITLNQLAKLLKISRGRISHFFATRDSIFVAIGEVYQLKVLQIVTNFSKEKQEIRFEDLQVLFERIMDNQYKYRCAVLYISGVGSSKNEMSKHLGNSYKNDKLRIRQMVEVMVQNNSLSPTILSEANYPVFEFQLVNLFTTWVISKVVYFPDQSYSSMKPFFLQGILRLFDPYLIK